ncbi:MAG: TRAP transporter small permease [candidate division NC10 bacterium]|nr:TRAP transporter small permease [candidate division NC10 bacterium]
MTVPGPGPFAGRWAKAERRLAAALRWGSILCLVALLFLLAGGVLVRFVPVVSMGWADEIVELSFAWMVFLGTAALWRSHEHIAIDFIPQALGGTPAGRALEVLLGLLALGFLAVFTWEGWLLTVQAVGNRTPILELPKPLWYVALPVSGVVMIGHTLRRCFRTLCPAGGPALRSPTPTPDL